MDKNMMIYLGLTFRAIQGSANAALYTTTYSIFSINFEGGDFMKINSIFKGTIGGGLLLGLLVGTVLYIIGGYFLPFLVYSILMLACSLYVLQFIPNKVLDEADSLPHSEKSSDEDIEIGEAKNSSSAQNDEMHDQDTVTKPTIIKRKNINPFKLVWRLLKNKIILKCLILSVIDMMLLNFAPAILSKRLAELNINKRLYGLFFALPFVLPLVSALIVVKVMEKIDSQILLCIGKLLMGVAFLLIGPSYYWGFQENIWVMLCGISLLGFSASFAIIPLMPMIMAEIKLKFVKNTHNYIDTASSLYNSAFGLGSILGPLVGAHLNSYFGFRICTDILSNFSVILFIILIITGNPLKIFRYFRKFFSGKKKQSTSGRLSVGSNSNIQPELRESTF
mmetsp:Transcript_1262/g.1409  ORF Transcript_1262/g.1409 Transcript_1262/m.1409 type:complete len:393 (-) Transcript_1262:53-1231(-)